VGISPFDAAFPQDASAARTAISNKILFIIWAVIAYPETKIVFSRDFSIFLKATTLLLQSGCKRIIFALEKIEP
jgi:hypothetical protein